MAKVYSLLCLSLAFVILTGCATSADDLPREAASQSAAPSSFSKGLAPQTLEPNECGLFLWSKNDISTFVFFTQAGQDTAVAYLEGKTTNLAITERAGALFGQFFTTYQFTVDDGRAVSLDYIPGETLTDGARVQSGAIQFADAEGWRTVLPVLGARVCQPNVAGPNSVAAAQNQ